VIVDAALLAAEAAEAAAAAAAEQATNARRANESALRSVSKLCDQLLPQGALMSRVPYRPYRRRRRLRRRPSSSPADPNVPTVNGDFYAGASTGNADPTVGALVRRLRQELKRKSARDATAVADAVADATAVAFTTGKAYFMERFMEITAGDFPEDIDSPEFTDFVLSLQSAKHMADEMDRMKNVLFDRQQALMVVRMKLEQEGYEHEKTKAELSRLHSEHNRLLAAERVPDATVNQPGLVAVHGDDRALPLRVTTQPNSSRGNKVQYTSDCIQAISAIVRKFKLGNQVANILHSALAFWIQKPVEFCVTNFPLPGATQQGVHTRMMGALGQQQHMTRLKEAPLFSLSADEAPIHRIKTFSVLATYTTAVRTKTETRVTGVRPTTLLSDA
jgi:hypothetical protein